MRIRISAVLILCMALVLAALGQNRDYYFSLFDSIDKSGDWADGERRFREAVRNYPDEVTFHLHLNTSLRKQKKFREALEQAAGMRAKFPGNNDVANSYRWSLHELGWQRFGERQYPEATELFKKAYDLDPGEEWSINGYGSCLREAGRAQEAIPILEEGMKRYGSNKWIKSNLVEAYVRSSEDVKKSDPARAEEYLHRAIALDPEHESALLFYGIHLRSKKDYAGALELFRKGIARYRNNKWFPINIKYMNYDRGRSLIDGGDLEGAIAVFSEATREYPDELYFPYYLGDCQLKKGNIAAASAAILSFAGIGGRTAMEPKDEANFRTSLYHLSSSVLTKMAGTGRFNDGFAFLDRIQNAFKERCLSMSLRGSFTYHAGRRKEGLSLVNGAYNAFIKDHPEYRIPVVVRPPVKGVFTVWGNDRTDAITHAGMNKYCFDFLGSTRDGEITRHAISGHGKNEDYIGFGMPLYSPVDGTVVSVVDDIRDLEPAGSYRLVDGNYVTIQDSAKRNHALVHNRYRSARVKVGDTVRAGDIVAEMGNTGMTTVPHLHYGVYSEDWLVSIPVQFTEYTVIKGATPGKVRTGTPKDREIIEIQ
ncbi:MAG: tetratricopeptide repeat protein [Spirochaetes bacterium]|nr:tetratricopeptide repeat protein [Spirochaetota bacterium]